MKMYEYNGELMTENELRWYAKGFIDGLASQGRPIDELPSIAEVIENADHVAYVDYEGRI